MKGTGDVGDICMYTDKRMTKGSGGLTSLKKARRSFNGTFYCSELNALLFLPYFVSKVAPQEEGRQNTMTFFKQAPRSGCHCCCWSVYLLDSPTPEAQWSHSESRGLLYLKVPIYSVI